MEREMRVFSLIALVFSLAYFTACSDKKSNNTGGNPIFNCLPGDFACDNGVLPVATDYPAQWGGNFRSSNSNVFEYLLEDYQQCTRHSIFLPNINSADCRHYGDGGDLYITYDPRQPGYVQLHFIAGESGGWFGLRQFSIQNVRVWATNDTTGMEFQATSGAPATLPSARFRGVVDVGNLSSSSYTVQLFYRGSVFATVNVNRF